MNIIDLLIRKREGEALTTDEIRWMVKAYTEGEVADYQMAAFLMAAFIRGMNTQETSALTHAMLYSGEVLDLSDVPGIKVDKHSTGGVGDKISIPLAPIVAAAGVPVPMISGRGLGHSGGTLDKMESVPGFNVKLDLATYRKQLGELGLVMIGQTDEIAPADRKMYALRDVTGTVPFMPFIASSIMSKKLAEGLDALVLDVKSGRGAFMDSFEKARELAKILTEIAAEFDKPAVAWITNMDAPLGYNVGNWLEMEESMRVLHGEVVPEVTELTLALASEMIWLGGKADNPAAGRVVAQQMIDSGAAFEKWLEVTRAQGGDDMVLRKPETYTGLAASSLVYADRSGYISGIDALEIGKTAVESGAGRMRKEDLVDGGAGIRLHAKPGTYVRAGEPIATLFTRKESMRPVLENRIRAAFAVQEDAVSPAPLCLERIVNAKVA